LVAIALGKRLIIADILDTPLKDYAEKLTSHFIFLRSVFVFYTIPKSGCPERFNNLTALIY
jgi:hypothetical protein